MCVSQDQTATDPFMAASDFGPVEPGTLAGWNPSGRWFFTGVAMPNISSVYLDQVGTGQVMMDRDPRSQGTIDADALLARTHVMSQGTDYTIALRVANRSPDGSARADRAVCDGGKCTVCTARLVRATHNANEGEGDHITLLGQLADPTWGPGYTFNVRHAGTLAFLIRQDGLHVIETADPAHPAQVGYYRHPGPGYSNDLKLVDVGSKRYAVIADLPSDVVDVTDPTSPHLVAQIPEQAHTLAIEARDGKLYAYFGNYDASCPIYDITDPTMPVRLGRFVTQGNLVHDLSIENGIAYLAAWDSGFLVVDFTTPATPTLLGTWAPTPEHTSHSTWPVHTAGRHLVLHGEEAYGAHLHIVDVDPASPTFMKPQVEWKTRDFISIHNLMAFGTKAYFTYYQDGVRVLDLSDPTAPAQVGYYNTWDPQAAYTTSAFFEGAVGLDVDLDRHLIFVADSPRGLLVLSDSTP